MKPIDYLLFILGLSLIGAGVYLYTIVTTVIKGYQEVPIVQSNLTKGYLKQAILAQTQPYRTIGISIIIIGALFLALSLVEIIESLRHYIAHSRVRDFAITE